MGCWMGRLMVYIETRISAAFDTQPLQHGLMKER
jgi:hypothetical protein